MTEQITPTNNQKEKTEEPKLKTEDRMGSFDSKLEPQVERVDPFDDLEGLRLTDATSFGVEKVLFDIPCDKPNRHVFCRVHPDPEYRFETGLFLDQTQRNEYYLVAKNIRDALAGDVVAVRLMTAITRHGDLFLWPIRLPGPDGRPNRWHESMASAAELAIDYWVRVTSNMLAGRYDVSKATGSLPEPEWPDKTFQELLKLSFETRFIDSYDHPVVKALRGEV